MILTLRSRRRNIAHDLRVRDNSYGADWPRETDETSERGVLQGVVPGTLSRFLIRSLLLQPMTTRACSEPTKTDRGRGPTSVSSSVARSAEDHHCGTWRKSAEGVGFEPTVGLHLLRFSRPSQSTTLAPLRIGTKLRAAEASWGRPDSRHLLLTDLVQNVVGDEDRHVDRHGQRDRVARP
jgi:hypothetical protein